MNNNPMQFEQKLNSENDLERFAQKCIQILIPPLFLALEGPLGAGKTTFVRAILRAWGYQEIVRSPTYTLLESYELPRLRIFHLDLYRLNDPQELIWLGVEEIFQTDVLCLIEWSEKGKGFLPEPDLICQILVEGDTQRCLKFNSLSKKGEAVLRHLTSMPDS